MRTTPTRTQAITRRLRVLFVLLIVGVYLRPGNSCAFSVDENVFTQRNDPDAPYNKYVAGRLGIIQSEYRIRHLVVAYNTLSGLGLTPAEQNAAIAVNTFYNTYAGDEAASESSSTTAPKAKQDWYTTTGSDDRKVPGQDWQTFRNCLQDAFATASATLTDRRARYAKQGAPDTPEIAAWIAAQRAVFSNCGGPGQVPQPAPANAPQWLRQDRAYQIAAAQFYALDYDQALDGFRAIAADHASPWSTLAPYLVARVLIRRAVVPYRFDSAPSDQMGPADTKVRAGLAQARAQLESILRDPAMKSIHPQSRQLLDYVMARLDPDAQADELARRLTAPRRAGSDSGDPNYRQDVIDLSFIYNSLPLYDTGSARQDKADPPSREPLIRWIDDLAMGAASFGFGLAALNQGGRDPDPRDPDKQGSDAKSVWKTTHQPQWLVAALTSASPGEESNADLIAAARAVAPDSPAFASVTYHRLRLAAGSPSPVGQTPATTQPVYAEIAGLMPQIVNSQPLSTVNLFADLQSSLSPTLNDFLQNATRRPASLSDSVNKDVLPIPETASSVTLCGVGIYAPETRHLDDQTALIFNQRMPLRMLKEAALSTALPANTRFQIAHMAWTRALLLDDPETARALSPFLSACQPAFASWIGQYDAARTPEERRVLGLLALMRFTSTEPVVRVGIERDFASYDEFRDNWWCVANPSQAGSGPQQDRAAYLFSDAIVPRAQQPDPPFLTAADREQAEGELSRLEKVPCASDYFARQALAWVKDQSADPRNADLLGFAMRVVRNACRSDATKELNHQLFDLLHRSYPKSEWAARYTTWE